MGRLLAQFLNIHGGGGFAEVKQRLIEVQRVGIIVVGAVAQGRRRRADARIAGLYGKLGIITGAGLADFALRLMDGAGGRAQSGMIFQGNGNTPLQREDVSVFNVIRREKTLGRDEKQQKEEENYFAHRSCRQPFQIVNRTFTDSISQIKSRSHLYQILCHCCVGSFKPFPTGP